MFLGGTFDLETKIERLKEIELELADSSVWDSPDYAQKLGKERASLEVVIGRVEKILRAIEDTSELLELAKEEEDSNIVDEVQVEIQEISRSFCNSRKDKLLSPSLIYKSCSAPKHHYPLSILLKKITSVNQ